MTGSPQTADIRLKSNIRAIGATGLDPRLPGHRNAGDECNFWKITNFGFRAGTISAGWAA
jgi:hypothetical protein